MHENGTASFLGAVTKLSVRLSVRMEQIDYQWTDFL